jgi:hypothetical protein
MRHRLMVICLGGLAGAGALVCCDLDEGLDELEAAPERETPDGSAEDGEPLEAEAKPGQVH